MHECVGEAGASSYRGRLLQSHFMQNSHRSIDGKIADSSYILIVDSYTVCDTKQVYTITPLKSKY